MAKEVEGKTESLGTAQAQATEPKTRLSNESMDIAKAQATEQNKKVDAQASEEKKPDAPAAEKKDNPNAYLQLFDPAVAPKFVDVGFGKQFAAQFIERDIKPSTYQARGGEKFEDIAKRHLGPGASTNDVKRYAYELNTVNSKDDRPDGKIEKGDTILLPGHTKDGTIYFKDYRGTRFTLEQDGKRTVKYIDGSGFERTTGDDGSVTKKYFGKKPEDNYTVKLDKEGKIVSNDRVDPGHREAGDIASERRRLTDLIDKKMTIGKERNEFKSNMEDFEKRAVDAGLPYKQIEQTYAEVSRILEGTGVTPLTNRERVRMASGIMRGAAFPTSNDQGEHNTCTLQGIENRLYTREPATVARALADIATTGKLVAADGSIVKMDYYDLRAHGEAGLNEARGTNTRTYASQVFQVATANAFYVSENENGIPPGQKKYSQTKREDEYDAGERMTDFSTKPGPTVERTLGEDAASAEGIIKMNQLLTGRKEERAVLSGHEIAKIDSKPHIFKSKEELVQMLKEAKAEGKPMSTIMVVHANSDAFLMKNTPNDPLMKEPKFMNFVADMHVVNVIDFDEKTGKVKVDNQWGDDNDRIAKPMSIDELYDSTKIVRGTKWLDRLEESWKDKKLGDNEAKQLRELMTGYIGLWAVQRTDGLPTDNDDITRTIAKYKELSTRFKGANHTTATKQVEELLKLDDAGVKKYLDKKV